MSCPRRAARRRESPRPTPSQATGPTEDEAGAAPGPAAHTVAIKVFFVILLCGRNVFVCVLMCGSSRTSSSLQRRGGLRDALARRSLVWIVSDSRWNSLTGIKFSDCFVTSGILLSCVVGNAAAAAARTDPEPPRRRSKQPCALDCTKAKVLAQVVGSAGPGRTQRPEGRTRADAGASRAGGVGGATPTRDSDTGPGYRLDPMESDAGLLGCAESPPTRRPPRGRSGRPGGGPPGVAVRRRQP